MRPSNNVGIWTSLSAVLVVAFASAPALAVSTADIDAGAQATLEKFYAQQPKHHELVEKAAAVLVFPSVTKGGIGVGGEHGEGALLVDGAVIDHYKLSGVSVGATLGLAHRSEIILFMTPDARDKFERSRGWTIGADAGAAGASKGAGGDYDSETLGRAVLAFVLGEHGLIGDLSLEGAKVTRLEQ